MVRRAGSVPVHRSLRLRCTSGFSARADRALQSVDGVAHRIERPCRTLDGPRCERPPCQPDGVRSAAHRPRHQHPRQESHGSSPLHSLSSETALDATLVTATPTHTPRRHRHGRALMSRPARRRRAELRQQLALHRSSGSRFSPAARTALPAARTALPVRRRVRCRRGRGRGCRRCGGGCRRCRCRSDRHAPLLTADPITVSVEVPAVAGLTGVHRGGSSSFRGAAVLVVWRVGHA